MNDGDEFGAVSPAGRRRRSRDDPSPRADDRDGGGLTLGSATEAAITLAGEDDADLIRRIAEQPRNDSGNAERFIARYGGDVIHVVRDGWFYFDDRIWSRELGEVAGKLYAQDTARRIPAETRLMVGDGVWGKAEERDHSRFATASGNVARINGMLDVAASRLSVRREDLDRDPFLLVVENGTIELGMAATAGDDPVRFVPTHRREDMLTRSAATRHEVDAECPRFLAFLAEIMPDAEVREFIQAWCGYSLTGDVGEQRLVLLYGAGANGKSTLVNILRGVLGLYCATIPVEMLLEDANKSAASATPELARLPGARLVFCSEPERRRRLSTAAIKMLTGGEPVTARALYGEFFEFQPTFKAWLSFNDRPTVPGDDEGLWRRILLIPFLVQIPPERRNKRLAQEIVAEEASGILNWMLDGYRLWRERGLKPPPAVQAATDEYRADSDPIGQFLDTCTDKIPNAAVMASDLYAAYERWAKQNAIDPWGRRAFGSAMTSRRERRGKSSSNMYLDRMLKKEWRVKADDDLPEERG